VSERAEEGAIGIRGVWGADLETGEERKNAYKFVFLSDLSGSCPPGTRARTRDLHVQLMSHRVIGNVDPRCRFTRTPCGRMCPLFSIFTVLPIPNPKWTPRHMLFKSAGTRRRSSLFCSRPGPHNSRRVLVWASMAG
jgi:hypothetical protein